ncbi:MAG: class I SAM-dependent methyltransferase [Bacteroidetes bacterium]|jgi:cyclopropane fatty-acyl-phospholipid synthase-like methyltransferase|nr:class I SAM-dependent methyltransferase [Bacteroidota bacterium]
MAEFWEEAFKDKQEMWGFEPAKSAVLAKNFFVEEGINNILIAGIGYGRNAQIFRENGIEVTGIEISKTAIALARKHYGMDMTIHHGSVTDMPFDNNQYDGIFCYGLIYLLDSNERAKLISDCYNQLSENGCMVFTAITKEAQTYGQGKQIGKDRFEMFGGVQLFFYDKVTIQEEFGKAGLFEITVVTENYPFYLIKCRKANTKKYEQ